MKPLTHLEFAIWLISPFLQSAVAIGLVRNKLIKELPFFFGYTIYHVVQVFVAMVALRTSYTAYFYVYWGSELFDALLTFLVIQEIFSTVFRPYEALRRAGMILFRVTLLMLVGAGIAMAVGVPKVMDYSDRVNALVAVQRSSLFIEAGLILLLILFSRLFGLSWRNYIFGVLLGFGVLACLMGTGIVLRSHVRPPFSDWCEDVIGYGYVAGILVWVYYMYMPSSSQEIDRSQVDASPLKGWNHALGGLLGR